MTLSGPCVDERRRRRRRCAGPRGRRGRGTPPRRPRARAAGRAGQRRDDARRRRCRRSPGRPRRRPRVRRRRPRRRRRARRRRRRARGRRRPAAAATRTRAAGRWGARRRRGTAARPSRPRRSAGRRRRGRRAGRRRPRRAARPSARRARARRGTRSRRAPCPGGGRRARAATSATACAADVAPETSSRRRASAHWVRCTCASQRPGMSHRPSSVDRAATSAASDGSDGGDPAVAQQDVDGRVAVHQASIAQQEVGGRSVRSACEHRRAGIRPDVPRPAGAPPGAGADRPRAAVDALHRAARPGAPAGGGDGGEHRRRAAGGPGARRRLAPRPARPRRRAGRPGAVRAQRPRPRAPGAPSRPGLGRPGGRPAGQLRHVRLPERRPAGLGVQPGRAALGRPRGPRARATPGRTGTGCRCSPGRSSPTTTRSTAASGSRGGSGRSPRGRRARTCVPRRSCSTRRPSSGPCRWTVPDARRRSARSRCPSSDVEELTGIDLGPLVDADVLAPVGALADRERWVPLTAVEQIRLYGVPHVRVAAGRHDHRRPGLRVRHHPARQPEHLAHERLGHDVGGRPLGDDQPRPSSR